MTLPSSDNAPSANRASDDVKIFKSLLELKLLREKITQKLCKAYLYENKIGYIT